MVSDFLDLATGSCELPSLGAENLSTVLCESSVLELLHHLSRVMFPTHFKHTHTHTHTHTHLIHLVADELSDFFSLESCVSHS